MNKLETLPVGRKAIAERKAGVSFASLAKEGGMEQVGAMELLIAATWQVKVHEGQKVTYDDIALHYSEAQLLEALGLDTDGDIDDPKET